MTWVLGLYHFVCKEFDDKPQTKDLDISLGDFLHVDLKETFRVFFFGIVVMSDTRFAEALSFWVYSKESLCRFTPVQVLTHFNPGLQPSLEML